MTGTFKIDKSFFGHIVEGQLLYATLGTMLLVQVLGLDLWTAYLYGGGILAIVYHLGREKRDCENALDLTAGSPRAYYLMWTRWSNVTDMAGNIIIYVAAWAVYASLS